MNNNTESTAKLVTIAMLGALAIQGLALVLTVAIMR
jgi:hypothetical protein